MLFSRPPAHKLAGVGALRRLHRLHPFSRAAPLGRSLQSSTDREQNVNISHSNPVELSEPMKPFEACHGNFGPAKMLVRPDQNCRKVVKILARP